MAKSAVTENIPKQTEFERDQHKVRVVSKTKAIWVLPGTHPVPRLRQSFCVTVI